MTVLEAVKRSHTVVFLHKAAIKTAQAALTAPETVLWAHTGNVIMDASLGGSKQGLQPGVTVVTSHRILFSHCVMGKRFIRSIALPDIGNIQSKPEGVTMSLHIYSLAGYLAIQGNSRSIPELQDALHTAIAAADNLNPAELEPFYTPVAEAKPAAPAQIAPEDIDLDPYFKTYYPSRMRAIRALRRDTGLNVSVCTQMIETYFSANLARVPMPKKVTFPDVKHILDPGLAAREKRMKELDRQGIAYCPKCISTSISTQRKGFSVSKAVATSFFFGEDAGLVAGSAGANELECFCMKCGHVWRP
jgi:hypothetical protein